MINGLVVICRKSYYILLKSVQIFALCVKNDSNITFGCRVVKT